MYRTATLALVLLAGVGIGAAGVTSLQAQNKGPGAYAIIDLSQITDRDAFVKQLLPKGESAALSAGGKFVTRTEKIVALDGTPPQRFVIIAFDSVDRAKVLERFGGPERGRRHAGEIHKVARVHRHRHRPRASHHDGPRLNAALQVKRPLHSITRRRGQARSQGYRGRVPSQS